MIMQQKKKQNTKTLGGCFERYENGELKKHLKLLELKYPFFKANKNYTGGFVNWRIK